MNGPALRGYPERAQESATKARMRDEVDDPPPDLSRSHFRNFIVLYLLNLRQRILTTKVRDNQSKVYRFLKYSLVSCRLPAGLYR